MNYIQFDLKVAVYVLFILLASELCHWQLFPHLCAWTEQIWPDIATPEGRKGYDDDLLFAVHRILLWTANKEHLIKNQGMTACHLLSPLAWLMRKPLQQPGPETFLCFHKHQEQEERSLTSCHTVTTGQLMLPGPVVYVLPLLSLYLYLLQPSSAGANCLFALVYWTRGHTWRLEYNVQDRAALCYSRSFLACLL